MGWSEDAALNRELWTKTNAEYTGDRARQKWEQEEITWGIWETPETELGVLGDVAGLDVVELGCGTAYFSAWLARRGARPVGVDITPAQLDSARAVMAELGLEFPLVEADGAETGLPDASCDLVLSEYGASIWVDPERWLPEAARLLRPGGRLVFMCGSTLSYLCTGDDDDLIGELLVRSQFGLGRLEWPDRSVEFHQPHGERIRLLRSSGFEVEDLIEIQAPAEATTHAYYGYISADWGRRWPAEEIWIARKRP
jgi:SAM-dependent methyltransferase